MRKADINLDFHQTVKETRKPFILGVDNPSNWELVRNISICDIFIEEPSENARRYGTLTGYADFLGKRHLCIEVSELSEREQAFNLTMKSVSSLLGYEKRDTEREIKKLKTVHSEAFSHKCMQLVPDLQNLEEVRKGQSLGSDGQGGDILCPFDGYLLFPKYLPRNGDGEVIGRLPLDIFELAVEI